MQPNGSCVAGMEDIKMIVKDVTDFLEQRFPLGSQASFDNCGLLVGHPLDEVRKVLVCLDCTEEVLDEALELGANLIVAHHPIIFKGLKSLTGRNYVERTVVKAIKNDLNIYAIHTNLDHAMQGVNAEIAQRLGLVDVEILDPNPGTLKKLVVFVPQDHVSIVERAMFQAGAGKLGNYEECAFESEGIGSFKPLPGADPFEGKVGSRTKTSEFRLEVLVSQHRLSGVIRAMKQAHPYEEVAYDVFAIENSDPQEGSGMIGNLPQPMDAMTFLAQVKQQFHCGCIRYTELPDHPIQRVALCGGAGSFLIGQALRSKADIYLTGDLKYHEFFDADKHIVLADIGHFESEQFTINLLTRILTENFTKFAVLNTKVNTNPINYL